MISALCWVRKGVAQQQPDKYELDEKEYERIKKLAKEHLEDAEQDLEEAQAEAKDKEAKPSNKESKDSNEDSELSIYNLDDYDDEPATAEKFSVFSNIKGLSYFASNEEDPYVTLKKDEDSDNEDTQIMPTDNLLLAAKTEDDISHLEAYVYEESEDNLYVHHDFMLPAFPLCVEWLDFRVGRKAHLEGSGNYVAVGTFEPEIEIWDLDTIDAMYPDAILGDSTSEPTEEAANKSSTKKKKKKKKKGPNPNCHTDAVMSLSWNRNHRNLLASSSADTTVKLWDLTTLKCARSFEHHKDKVQCVQWNPVEATVMLTASYDKTVAAFDSRAPESVSSWKLSADPECVRWDPFAPESFFVSTELGLVHKYDARNMAGGPIFTLHAHDSPVSALDISPLVSGCLVTGSGDKTVKIWDLKDNKPSMVLSRDLGVGKVFSAAFCPDSPFQLALAGSKGHVQIWDISSNAGVRRAFDGRGVQLPEVTEKAPVGLPYDPNEEEEEDDDEEANGAENGAAQEMDDDEEEEDEEEDDEMDM
ncbi:uncharacterized protein VTP21DRAFT_11607 [Calcarisporiella thermophila]|uniref:uncharacterized protein n=1 Tax=Calcarisporiella thermophila TaxID=911321 RepID=UPI003741FE81